MKHLLALLILMLTTVCVAQKRITWEAVKTVRIGKEVTFTNKKGKPLKGNYTIASVKGSYSTMPFSKGKIDGMRKDYDLEEKLIASRAFKKGKAHGAWMYYNADGTIKVIENYNAGLKSGKWWKKIRQNNTYFTSTSFYNNDIPEGHWTEKRADSTLISEKTYKGKGSYIAKEYYITGKLKNQESFINFKLDGEQLTYTKMGILLSKLNFKNGVIVKKETFYKNGRPDNYCTYKNGRPHGKCIGYKRSGALAFEEDYDNGDKSGVFKKYLGTEGWLHFVTTYKNDTPHGSHKMYYRNKNIEQEGNYINGSKEGLWKYYHINGKLKREVTYDKGVEIDRKEYSY